MVNKKILIILFFFLINNVYSNKLDIKVELDKKSIKFNEILFYTIIISGKKIPDNISVDKIYNFKIIDKKEFFSGNSYFQLNNKSQFQSNLNSKFYRMEFMLLPLKTGELIIGPFDFKFDNKVYTIPELKVEVNKTLKKAQNEKFIKSGNYTDFVVTDFSDSQLYLNQLLVIKYYVYSLQKFSLGNQTVYPDFFGFKKEKIFIEDKKEKIRNKNYFVKEITVLLNSIKNGSFVIEPAVFQIIKGFSDFLKTGNEKLVISNSIRIKIDTLKHKTKNFSGIISDSVIMEVFTDTFTFKPKTLFKVNNIIKGEFTYTNLNKIIPEFPEFVKLVNIEKEVLQQSFINNKIYSEIKLTYYFVSKKETPFSIKFFTYFYSPNSKKIKILKKNILIK